MQIVVDTSILVAVISEESQKALIVNKTEGMSLVAPASVHWEIGNAFSAMLKRKRVSFPKIKRALEVYKKIPIQFIDIELIQSLEIASKYHLYAYDAYLLCTAKNYKLPLLTLDADLKKKAAEMSIKLMEV